MQVESCRWMIARGPFQGPGLTLAVLGRPNQPCMMAPGRFLPTRRLASAPPPNVIMCIFRLFNKAPMAVGAETREPVGHAGLPAHPYKLTLRCSSHASKM